MRPNPDQMGLPRQECNGRKNGGQGCDKSRFYRAQTGSRQSGSLSSRQRGIVRRTAHAALAGVAAAMLLVTATTGADVPEQAAPSALEQAQSLRAAGRFEEALDVLRTESREIKRKFGDNSLNLLPVNDLAAEILIDSGSLDTARQLLEKTMAARRQLIEEGRREYAPALGNSLLTLARHETAAKRLPAAADAARQALGLFASALDPVAKDTERASKALADAISTLDGLVGSNAEATRKARVDAATTFTSLGMVREAIDQRQHMLEGLLSATDAKAADIRTASEQLGAQMLLAGRATEAVALLEKSLVRLGTGSRAETLPVRRLLGDLQLAGDQLALAGASYQQAFEDGQALGQSVALITAGDRLRGLLASVRRGEIARVPDWFEATVLNLSRASPGDAPAAIAGLVVAARVQESLGDSSAAAGLLDRALALATAAKAPDADRTADVSARLAAARLAMGDITEARKILDRALPAAEAALGEFHARTAQLRVLQADALLRAGDAEAADVAARKALRRGVPRPDADWEDLATDVYDRLAAALDQDDLRSLYLAARAEQFGDQHHHVGAACERFGVARLAAGDWPAAVDFFSRAAGIHQRGDDDDRSDLAANLVLLAHAQRLAGLTKNAMETAARAVDAWERSAGPDHPGTLSAVEVLLATKAGGSDATGVVDLLERLCRTDEREGMDRRASHLIRLADAIATSNKSRAKELLQQAMQLPCWDADMAAYPHTSRRLALASAIAAHAFRAIGDPTAATESLQRARRLAMQAKDPKPILDRVERLADQGERPSNRP